MCFSCNMDLLLRETLHCLVVNGTCKHLGKEHGVSTISYNKHKGENCQDSYTYNFTFHNKHESL